MIKKILIVFAILFNTNSYGGTIRPEVPDSEYLEYGKKYKCIVKISGSYKLDSKVVVSASGVVIEKNWLLTAAHIFEDMENPYFLLEEKRHLIKEIIMHNEFDAKSDKVSSGDIALCFVEDVMIDFFPKLYEKDDEQNKICGIAGYGRTGNAISGSQRYDGKKRAGSNTISLVTENVLFCEMSKINPTRLEFLISHGDSGGGLFIDGQLAGINSFVSRYGSQKPDSRFGNESGHTRISKYKNWIEINIKNHK